MILLNHYVQWIWSSSILDVCMIHLLGTSEGVLSSLKYLEAIETIVDIVA